MAIRQWARMLGVLSGLTGAGGVILAAVSAHLMPNAGLHNAAHLVLIHAAAAAGLSGLALAAPRRGMWFAGAALVLLSGSLAFGAGMVLGTLLKNEMFFVAAPLGGMLLIGGWVLAAVAAAIAFGPS